MPDTPARRHVVPPGCSGGGKSTLLVELAARGHATVPEPGRRIVAGALAGDGGPLPWVDPAAFAARAMQVAFEDRLRHRDIRGWVFFDRGLVDAAVARTEATGARLEDLLDGTERYHRTVFLTPPWPEIYRADTVRRHDMTAAIAEHDRLLTAYAKLGYDTVLLPRVCVAARADMVLARLDTRA
ncbi:AAA family ATPase [Pseudooceanicola sp. LIPI14-2-Ac024]|uniref:AAA family ATPase n=1 Tax=Pseudooceanicola sp. LIPI14-2-Ac024 TaxID=3344875 RepID=UPI0035D058EE